MYHLYPSPLIGELTALTQLSLSHNKGISSLPNEVTKLTNLTKLDFTGIVFYVPSNLKLDNKLVSMPDIKNLAILKLSNNGLSTFNLTHLLNVKELHINSNQVFM